MFKSLKRITYLVEDIEKAKKWYCKILNTEPVFDTPFAAIFNIGGNSLSIVKQTGPLHSDNERSTTYWEVDDIDDSYKTLLESGATSHTEVKTILNIKTAKVIDPFGNIIGITGMADSKKQAVENQPSETAMNVAFSRAIAALEDREKIKGRDYIAEIFLDDDKKKYLKDKMLREVAINKFITPRLYGYLLARTAFIDNVFEKALIEKIPQILFLGAGYDSRSCRFSALIKETKIFELDINTTQEYKKKMLLQSKIKIPDQLTFVAINFKTDSIEKALLDTGYDKNKKTLFIWEGVMYYLSAQAVDETLKFVKSNSPSGSTICFDYIDRTG